jgi:hypothetical protein
MMAESAVERLRVVSLLPAATDIVHCLGLSRLLIGCSHEVRCKQFWYVPQIILLKAAKLSILALQTRSKMNFCLLFYDWNASDCVGTVIQAIEQVPGALFRCEGWPGFIPDACCSEFAECFNKRILS